MEYQIKCKEDLFRNISPLLFYLIRISIYQLIKERQGKQETTNYIKYPANFKSINISTLCMSTRICFVIALIAIRFKQLI